MKMKRPMEYKILPQMEGEGMYELEKPRNLCLSCLIFITLIFLLSGIAVLCVSLWWSKEFHEAVDTFWPTHPNFTSAWEHFDDAGTAVSDSPGNSSSSSSSEYYYDYSSADYGGNGTTEMNPASGGANMTAEEINQNNIGRKFAEAMRKFEQQMETLSGIHQAELVIPLFMLVTFLSMLALISLCCCLMSKQREKRQRKLLAKVITDLQTGDKTFLLGNKEDDF